MKLIDKDALVAEIDKKIEFLAPYLGACAGQVAAEASNKIAAYGSVKEIIYTLEVKEVDLEKAIDDYIYTHDGRKRLALELDWKCCNLTLKGGDEIIKFARYFFELGLNASNPLTWEDVRLMAEIGDKFMNSEESDNLSEEDYYKEILNRFKAQKGE